MIFSGSVVYVDPEHVDQVRDFLGSIKEAEIFTVSPDSAQVVISIEAEDDTDLERICAQIKSNESVIEVAHHIFNFEDDVDAIISGEKKPSLDGFFRGSRRRESN